MLFGGKLAIFTRNFGFNLHLKILNTHNHIWPGTLPMVNLHIVPIVPKIWGHFTILYATWHHTPNWEQISLRVNDTWHQGLWGHHEPPSNLTCFHVAPTEFPFWACLLPVLLQIYPRADSAILVLGGYKQNHTSEGGRANTFSNTKKYFACSGQINILSGLPCQQHKRWSLFHLEILIHSPLI